MYAVGGSRQSADPELGLYCEFPHAMHGPPFGPVNPRTTRRRVGWLWGRRGGRGLWGRRRGRRLWFRRRGRRLWGRGRGRRLWRCRRGRGSVRSSHLLSSSEISRPSSSRVSARSLISSPRCDFTFIRKVALPARTRCVRRQTISPRISASGAVANVAFPPFPIHFLISHKAASLSHNRRTSSLRADDCNASTTPDSGGDQSLCYGRRSQELEHEW
jgi:hypothetical protein